MRTAAGAAVIGLLLWWHRHLPAKAIEHSYIRRVAARETATLVRQED